MVRRVRRQHILLVGKIIVVMVCKPAGNLAPALRNRKNGKDTLAIMEEFPKETNNEGDDGVLTKCQMIQPKKMLKSLLK